jgi:acetoin utilization deacetylase AcuC-like enzyme
VLPVLVQFAPQLTLVSAGFDAHERDPLASMRVTTEGYFSIVAAITSIARSHGALALVTEGGYDLDALTECLEASFLAVNNGGAWSAPGDRSSPRGDRAIDAVRAAHSRYWRL